MRPSSHTTLPTLLSPTQFAAEAGICRATVYNLINRGEIRVVKLGRRLTRIPLSELQRLAAAATDVHGGAA